MPFTAINPSTAAAAPATLVGLPLQNIGDTLLSMRTEMTADLFNRSDIAATRMTKWLNWGYRSICQMLDLQQLWGSVSINVVANQPFYLIPRSISWIKRVALEDSTDFVLQGGRELDMIDLPTYRTLPDTSALQLGSSMTYPTKWFRFGTILVLYPTPVASFTVALDFRVRPLDMVADTDCPILPTEFHEPVYYAGLERAYTGLRDMRMAGQIGNYKLGLLRSLINPDAEEQDAMHMSLRPITSHSQLFNQSDIG